MRKKFIWYILAGIVLVIQFIPAGRPDNITENSSDLLVIENIPDSVVSILKTACYDCHSNQTHYPFYGKVAPVSWLVARDVRLGREEMNFSNWADLETNQKARWLADIADEVEGEEMPMAIYTLMHWDAKLDEADRQLVIDWANNMGESLYE